MTLATWARLFLVWGLVGALLGALPAIILGLLPPQYSGNFIGLVAALLSLSVTPLALVIAFMGAILLLVAVLRRDRS